MKTVQLMVCTSYSGCKDLLWMFFLSSNFEEQQVIQKETKSVDEKLCIKSFSKLPSEIHFLRADKGDPPTRRPQHLRHRGPKDKLSQHCQSTMKTVQLVVCTIYTGCKDLLGMFFPV